jgi:hypothetical protein
MVIRLIRNLKLFGIYAMLILSGYARATSVTATITDSDTQTWNNCVWRVTLNNPRPDITPSVSGTALTAGQISQSGTCNSSGVITVTLVDNSTINISGTTWTFNISPNASAPGATGSVAVSGSSQSLSVYLSSIVTAPRFNSGSSSYGYLDAEVRTPLPGGTYYNVSTPALRLWYGTAWSSIGSGGSGLADCTDTTGVSFVCTVPTTISTSIVSGPSLIVSNSSSSNLSAIQQSSAGGHTYTLNAGGTDFLNGAYYLFDVTAGTFPFIASNTYFAIPNTVIFNFGGGSPLAGFSADSAGVIDVGNGSAYQDKSGTIKAAHLFAGANEATVTAATTANAAVCLKSAGPPVVLGVCSSVVGAGGACTCN